MSDQPFLPGFGPPPEITPEERALSHLKWVMKDYPPDNVEWEIMISGIRLARFMLETECHGCPLDCRDHSVNWVFPTKICLLDYLKLLKRLGLRPPKII